MPLESFASNRFFRNIDGKFRLGIRLRDGDHLLDDRIFQFNRDQSHFGAVVFENVAEGRRNDRPKTVVQQCPWRMFPAGAASKVFPGKQNDCVFVFRTIHDKVRIFPPIFEKIAGHIGALGKFHRIAWRDLVRVDIRKSQRQCLSGNVGVLTKIVSIMDFLAENGSGDLNTISKGTGIPRSTVHRLLSDLEEAHLVAKTREGYTIGPKIAIWSDSAYAKIIAEAAKPILKKLTESTNESSQVYIREGEQRICITSVNVAGLANMVPVGSIFPIGAGSAGKVFKIWEDEISNKEYDAIRRQGWVESVAEREPGVASVSAPIFSKSGKLIAAISVSGPISRLGEKPSEKLAAHVLKAARELNEKLNEG